METKIKYFNSQEAAKILNVNVSTIKRWTDEGELNCIRTAGGHRKFTMQHLAEHLRKNKKKTSKDHFFPIEDEQDMVVNSHILKGNYDFLIDYVFEVAKNANRQKVQHVLNGLYVRRFPLHEIYDKLLTPVLHRNGEDWEQGKINIVQEHFSTQIIRDMIIQLQSIVQISKEKHGKAFCLTLSTEMHDIAIKMVQHILELNGFQVLYSGQMTPTLRIEQIFELHKPDYLFISSTIISDLNLNQAEFDKICHMSEKYGADIYVGGQGFDQIDHNHITVKSRLFSFKQLDSLFNDSK